MISVSSSGSTARTEAFLKKMLHGDIFAGLDALARQGVTALATATPKDSGLTSSTWDYRIQRSGSSLSIEWLNTDVESGFPVAIMLQYGYATGTGGYVAGRDYINPAMKPIFDMIAERVWKVVTSA